MRSYRSVAIVAVVVLACQSCTSVATYGQDRLRDLSDVVDVRYGVGFGLGAKVQAWLFETSLGYSVESYQRQWFGRKSVEVREGLFAGGLVVGVDGEYAKPWTWPPGGSSTTETYLLLWRNMGKNPQASGSEEWFGKPGGDVPRLDQVRVGGTIFLPGVSGGLYLNIGELADFLCGLVGGDFMHDDGIPKFTPPPDSAAIPVNG